MIKIYTDGSCLGNLGAGGWAAIIVDENNHREEIFDGEANTTNNRMELTTAIRGLEKIPSGTSVELFTDSSYLKNAFTNGWLVKWKRNGWKTATKSPVLNKDLWLALDELISNRTVNFHWVKGHAGHFFNERCDELARGAAARIKVVPKVLPPVKSAPRVEKIPESTPVKPKMISVPEENLPRGQLSLF